MFKFTTVFAQATGTLSLLQARDIAPHTQQHAIRALNEAAQTVTCGGGGGEQDFTALINAADAVLGDQCFATQMEYLTALKNAIVQLSSLSYSEAV